MTNDSGTPRPWRLVEVWGDTVDQTHLAGAIAIGIGVSMAAFLVANHVLAATVTRPELARAYAMLAGLAGCVLAGVVSALLFKPKRVVVEGSDVDPVWRQEVLTRMAEATGDLGSMDDLPRSVVDEMKALEIHDLFAQHPRAGRRTGSV